MSSLPEPSADAFLSQFADIYNRDGGFRESVLVGLTKAVVAMARSIVNAGRVDCFIVLVRQP
jgi:hypothetical protein